MKNMYDIVCRGDVYNHGKLLLDDFCICKCCRKFYPADQCPDVILADPNFLKTKSVYDFVISTHVYKRPFSVDIARKSFLEQLGWEDVVKNFSLGKVFYPLIKIDCRQSPFNTDMLQPGELCKEWVSLRSLNSIQPRGKCIQTTGRYICPECNCLHYGSADQYYIDGTFDYETMYEYTGLIVPEKNYERIKDLDWKKIHLYKPRKIKIVKHPLDGFPLDLRVDCPKQWETAIEYMERNSVSSAIKKNN